MELLKYFDMDNSLIVLEKINRKEFDALKREFGDTLAFQGSKYYGVNENSGIDRGNNFEEERAEIALSITLLRELTKENSPHLSKIQIRLARAKTVRMIATIVSSITGAGLIAAILQDHKPMELLTAILNFSSSIFLIIANYYETPRIGGATNLHQIFGELIAIGSDAHQLEFKLNKIYATEDFQNTEVPKLLLNVENLADRFRKFLPYL